MTPFISRTSSLSFRKLRSRDVMSIRGRAIGQNSSTINIPWISRAEPHIPRHVDAIMVLAGGQTSTGSGLPPWCERRLDAAAAIQKSTMSNTGAMPSLICLGGGTPHKPPILSEDGYVYHESTNCADYLIKQCQISPTTILKEVSSFDTVGNAFFSLSIHAIPARLRSIVVITSDFHMPRTKALFEDMYSLAANDLFGHPDLFYLSYVSVSDEGLFSDEVLVARIEKEAKSLQHWKSQQLETFQELHAWLHSTHQCYSVSRQQEFSKKTISDPRLLASY